MRFARDRLTTAVELGEDLADEPWLVATGTARGLEDDVAGDALGGLGGAPADDDGALAAVPQVEDLEWDRGLAALADLEGSAGREGDGAEGGGAGGAATVDEGADGVGVVLEVDGHGLVGEGVAVVGDEGLEVVGDGLGLLEGHADIVAVLLDEGWGGEGADGEDGRSDESTHIDGVDGLDVVEKI
nr:hypothetical protein CFP56_29890 [Quercus suber]